MFSEDKVCPLIYAAVLSLHPTIAKNMKCLRDLCEWYGAGCPAYGTPLEVELFKNDKAFFEELHKDEKK